MHQHESAPPNTNQPVTHEQEPTEATPSQPGAPSTGDDVMNILADVEQKFDKLREFQKSHEHELTSLNQRRCALDEAQRELEEERGKLIEQHDDLERQRQALQQQGEQLAGTRSEIESDRRQLDEQQASLEQLERTLTEQREQIGEQAEQIERARTDLEQERQQWSEHRQQREQEIQAQHEALEQRREELLQRERDQQGTAETLQQLEQEVHEQKLQLDDQRTQWQQQRQSQEQELSDRAAELEQRSSQLDVMNEAIQEQHQQALALQEQVEQKQLALDARSAELVAEHEQLRGELAAAQNSQRQAVEELESQSRRLADAQEQAQQLQRDAEAAAQQRDETAQQRDEAAQRNEALSARVEELTERVQQQEASLSESEQRLSTAGEKLRHFAEILNEQAPQLERGASALAMVGEQRQRIEQLNKQLAQAKRAGDPQELARRDDRIAQLTEALQQARGQIDAKSDASELQIQIAELSRRNEELVARLEDAQLAAEQAKEELKQVEARGAQAPTEQQRHAIEAITAEHEHTIELLRNEHQQNLQQYRSKRDAQVQSMQEQVSKLQQSLIDAKQQASGGGESGESIKAFQARIAELEAELERARASDPQQIDEQVRRKIKRVNAVASHLKRRRARLRRARELMARRHHQTAQQLAASQQSGASANRDELQRQMRAIEQQRSELAEVRQFLAMSEKELMRRWARPKAIASVGWMVLLTLFAAAASWFATDYISPVPVTATVSFSPQPENPTEFGPDDAAAWQRWHAEYILSGDFHKALARRCADRNFEPYDNVDVLTTRLRDDLSLDLRDPKKITASLQGLDSEKSKLLLDMFASTLALESSRHLGRGNQTARAVPLGEHKGDGRVSYATLLHQPPITAQIRAKAPLFGGILGGLLLLIVIVYILLRRSKRVFDTESAVFGGSGSGEGELLSV